MITYVTAAGDLLPGQLLMSHAGNVFMVISVVHSPRTCTVSFMPSAYGMFTYEYSHDQQFQAVAK